MKLGDRPKRTITKEAWAKFAPKCARPLHVAPLSRRAKLKAENNAPPGPGPCARGTRATLPWGLTPSPATPRTRERPGGNFFFPCTKQRRGGGPHRARVPVRSTRAPGGPSACAHLLGGGMHRAHRGSLLPTALGDPGDKRVAGASPRVARGRRERAGLGGARPSSCSSSSPLAFAAPGPSRASRRAGPAGRDCSRGGGARRWPAVARYARSRRRCLIFLRRETCSAPPPRPAPPAEATPPGSHAPALRKPPPLSRRGRAPTGCAPRIPPPPLAATLTHATSPPPTARTPTDITMAPRVNQHLMLKCFRRRY